MRPAQAMIQGIRIPKNAILIGYIDRHPADKVGIGWAVLSYPATGIEVAWDGQRTRSLPTGWRKECPLIPVASQAAVLGAMGGSVTSAAKTAAARANGAKGGRPKKTQS